MYCPVHTDDSLVYVCTDSPILDTDSSTGLYHIAGPNCPEDSLRQMCLPDYERKHIGTATAQDERYRKSVVESYGICTVHTEALPTVEDPEDTEPPSNNTNTTPDNQSTPPSWLGVAPWEQPATDPEDTTENEPEDQPDAQEPNDPNLDLPQDETEDQEDDFWWIDW
jgi:penicillin-binding protein 1A